MREPREPTHFETRPTEDVSEDVAVLWVNESFIKESTVKTEGETLAAFAARLGVEQGDAKSRGYKLYVLTGSAGKQEGYHGYTFGKPKNESEKLTPWRTTPTTMDIPWPAWLLNLYGGMARRKLDEEAGVTGTDDTSNTVKRFEFEDRYQLIPGGTYKTPVQIEEYKSATKFEGFTAETPVPTTVRYNYKGAQLTLDCLHDDVTIPEQTEGFEKEDGFGMSGTADLPAGQFFPATSPTGWQPYIYDVKQRFKEGLWHLEITRITDLPPIPEPLRF